MKFKKFIVNPLQVNCYLLWDEDTREAAFIDCGTWYSSEQKDITEFVKKEDIHPILSLQTHMHFDHIWGAPFLFQEWGLKPYCHVLEKANYERQPSMVRTFGIEFSLSSMPPVQYVLHEKDNIRLGSTDIEVIHTPGHSEGCICFYLKGEKLIFSGDTLFQGSIGRTDFEGGSMEEEMVSLQKLFLLPDDTKVYPGHGPSTTIGWEKECNPYWR